MAKSHIPEEILQQFSSYLQVDLEGDSRENSEKSSTLAAMCQASKSCQRVAEQYLYRTIIVKAGSTMYYERKTNIVRLLNILLTGPRQTSHVRKIFVTGWQVFERPQQHSLCYELSEDAQDYLHAALYCSQLSAPVQHILYKSVYRGIEDALLAILLLLCTNLEHLDIPIAYDFHLTRFMSFARECVDKALQAQPPTLWSRPLPLSKLRYFGMRLEEDSDDSENTNYGVWGHWDSLEDMDEGSFRFSQYESTVAAISDLLRLPLVTSVRALRSSEHLLYPQLDCSPHNSNIRKLYLGLDRLSVSKVEVTLQAFPNLVDLRLVAVTLVPPSPWDFNVYQVLGDILRAYGTRLQNLEVKTMYNGKPCEEIGDLRGLTALRTLSCFPTAFVQQRARPWQHDFTPFAMALPRSLRRLEIAQCDDPGITSGIAGLRGFLETQAEQLLGDEEYSDLKEVKLQSQYVSVTCGESWEKSSPGDWMVCRKSRD